MTLSAQLWGHSRPAKANVLGQQKLGCQETEHDLNESSESAPHSVILPVYLDAFARFKEAQERNASPRCELFAGRGSDALYQGTTLVGPYKATTHGALQAAEKLNSLKATAFRPSVSDCNYVWL
jgi:hypothetical protein